MKQCEFAAFPFSAGLSGLFAAALAILKENLARHRKNTLVCKPVEQRSQKARVDKHVIVQQHHYVVLGSVYANIVPVREVVVAIQSNNSDFGKSVAEELDAVVLASIVDYDDLVVSLIFSDRRQHRRQAFLQQMTAIVVQHHDAGLFPFRQGRLRTSSLSKNADKPSHRIS